MKNKILLILLGIILFGTKISYSQSIFTNKEEVAEYLVGEWNLDVVQGGFAGGTYYLPSPNYYDSTFHRVVFEKTGIDSIPLVCKAFIEDTLFQMTYVKISENPSQIILPRWLLFDLPENLEVNTGMMESQGFYGFSQDTMVLSGTVADGFEFGLSRLSTSTVETIQYEDVNIYPNPSDGKVFIRGVPPNSPFKLYAIDGRFVKGGRINGNSLRFDNNGIFILKLKLMDRWITKKIINRSNF